MIERIKQVLTDCRVEHKAAESSDNCLEMAYWTLTIMHLKIALVNAKDAMEKRNGPLTQ